MKNHLSGIQIPHNTRVVASGNLLVLLSQIGDDVCKILLPVHVLPFRTYVLLTKGFVGIPDVKTWKYIPPRVFIMELFAICAGEDIGGISFS